MKLKRYQARDMREALRQVRQELGPDAVILSTIDAAGGVEVVAADDSDGVVQASALAAVPTTGAIPVRAALPHRLSTPVLHEASNESLSAEIRSMRALLERRLQALSWNDFTRRDPRRARLHTDLMELGFGHEHAASIAQSLPPGLEDAEPTGVADGAQTADVYSSVIAPRIHTLPLARMLNGPVALIGPAGVGKSTLMAKLAVRGVVEHGAESIGIISVGDDRPDASSLCLSIGRLLGIATHIALTSESCLEQAQVWSRRRLILIDTKGLVPDSQHGLQALRSSASRSLSLAMVLSASSQVEVNDRYLAQCADLAPDMLVYTRLDEAQQLGGMLSTLISSQRPLAALSDGPRIPEDLQSARSDDLAVRAQALRVGNSIQLEGQYAAA
jgi:flagellar biosynthesis protein FlhF